MNLERKILGKIFLIIFSVILVLAFYKGLITTPSEGDSVDYHIPIAKAFLTGQILTPDKISSPFHTQYYPSNADGILSLFVLFDVPLGLFNVFGILLLLFASLKAARSFKIEENLSIIFAVSICTLNGILRWADTQVVDIYLLSFFLLSISFFESLKKDPKSYLKLGLSYGLLVGSKFSAPFIGLALIIVYFKKFIENVSLKSLIFFLIPFLVFGVSWYLRNLILTGNPFYPQKFLFFPGRESTILNVSVLDNLTGALPGLIGTINAFISEFMIWVFLIPLTISYFLWRRKEKIYKEISKRLIFLGALILLVVLNLPSSIEPHIMVSSLRYFHTAVTPLILFVFIFWERRTNGFLILSILSLTSIMFVEFPLGYFPKLLFFAAPIALFIYFRGYDVLLSKVKKMD